MSVLVRYSTGPMTAEQYDEALRRVQAVAGEWPLHGLEYHVCFGRDKNLQVIDVILARTVRGIRAMAHPAPGARRSAFGRMQGL